MAGLIPDGFTFATDASPADWIVERLRPWGKDRVRLWSFMPDVFDRYARVFHPFHGAGVTRIRWSELAARRRVNLEPTTRFRDVTASDAQAEERDWENEPSDGMLEQDQVAALRDVLAPHTSTPERCWLGVWVGWGSWYPGSRSTLIAVSEGHAGELPSRGEDGQPPDHAARVKTQNREYFLLSSGLDVVPSFGIHGRHQSPSIWWPEDRAWCVVTEVDGYSTYVGGTRAGIEAVLNSTALEAVPVPPDVPMDPGPY